MPKVLILQTDNRLTLDFLGLTRKANEKAVDYLQNMEHKTFDYHYEFIFLEERHYSGKCPAVGKIFLMDELLQEAKYDYIVFLDSDAWLQNPVYLNTLLLSIDDKEDIHGSFSRDPYMRKNTYINSGSFIIKVNDFIRQMYKEIIEHFHAFDRYHNKWAYDQYYISDKIFKKRKHFVIFIPHVLNTPHGHILRHNWCKNYRMYNDLYRILDSNFRYNDSDNFDYDHHLDREPFPNPNEYSWNYDD